jgi:amino acid permease
MVETSTKEAASEVGNVAATASGVEADMTSLQPTELEATSTTTSLTEKLWHSRSSVKSVLGEFANLLKGFLGLNFLYVSYAFSYAGITRGVVGLALVSTLTFYGCILLVRVKRNIPSDWWQSERASSRDRGARATFTEVDTTTAESSWGFPSRQVLYGDVGAYAFGHIGELAVNLSLLLTQFGYCTGYLIFLSQTIHDLLRCTCQPSWFLLIPLPIVLTLALLRSLRKLTPFSFLANLGIFVGFTAVLGFLVAHFEYEAYSPVVWKWPVFFGQMSAALEGIGVVLPVEGSMKNPRRFTLILTATMALMSAILLLIGLLGFMTFGKETRSIILLNMGHSVAVRIVKVVACIGILFTYPLQLVPIVQALEAWLSTKEWLRRRSHHQERSVPDSFGSPSPSQTVDFMDPMTTESIQVVETTRLPERNALKSARHDPTDDLEPVASSMDIVDSRLTPEFALQETDGEHHADTEIGPKIPYAPSAQTASAQNAAPSAETTSSATSSTDPSTDRQSSSLHGRSAKLIQKLHGFCRAYFTDDPLEVLVRVTLVVGTALAAVIAGRDFGLFQSLVGALGAATLAYTLPALFHLRIFWRRLSAWERALDIIMLIFGLGATLTATITTIMEMVHGTDAPVS